ncbi:metallophosphoesterase [Mucilaginibacter pallidiroseus]|uniref:Metallophosphoesterase n=1 Tax=Mucilaginibacter pallidiroseus TaxID=2599295 RepID=A0A563U366_9SPHI|nr:metallophosphoesterase [Mucilaginibacter pallidiroseus]TWR25787.1 metallophosphoesterase [Mucilaginibacter pallidiroseus]
MRRGGFFNMFIIISVITLIMDWYVFNGLKTFTADWQSRVARNVVTWGYLVLSVGVTILFVLGFVVGDMSKGMPTYQTWLFSIFLMMLVTKLVFIIVLSLGDLTRFIYGIAENVSGKRKEGEPYFPSRRKFVSELAILIAAFPFASFLYAMVRGKYDYKVHRSTIFFEDLPEAFDGFTITQLSDIHSGSFDNTEAMQKGIDLAKAQQSDLFVFTGDLVNNGAWEIEPYIDRFGSIKAPFGQFSILGNHDYGDYLQWPSPQAKVDNLNKLKKHHAELGYRLLLDENVSLVKDGQKISLIGVQNWGRGFIQLGDLNKALKGVDKDAFKVLLSHDPTHWEEQVRYHDTDIHLTLSGHTHGAQFGVETAGLRWSPVQYRYLDWAGLIAQGKRHLYVNRGFGFLGFSGRLGIWPEITVITLKKGKA